MWSSSVGLGGALDWLELSLGRFDIRQARPLLHVDFETARVFDPRNDAGIGQRQFDLLSDGQARAV
jgi:hypothetical protein